MKKNMLHWIEQMMASEKKKTMPVLSFPGAGLIGASVKEVVTCGHVQAACMQAIAKRYQMAAALSCMDLSVEAEAFGAKIIFSEFEVPSIGGSLVNCDQDVASLRVPSVGAGRTAECIKAIQIASEKIDDRPVFAGVIGPFSLAGRLIEMTEVMIMAMTNPEIVHAVLAKCTTFLTEYILALKQAGADGVVMAEPAAGLLSPALCNELSSAYIKKIIAATQDERFIVVYHNCGNTAKLAEPILATGAKVIHLGNAVSLPDAISHYPTTILIMGNISPSEVLMGGTPALVAEKTLALLQSMAGHKNWIISSGCDIPPSTPIANIDAYFSTIEQYYAY